MVLYSMGPERAELNKESMEFVGCLSLQTANWLSRSSSHDLITRHIPKKVDLSSISIMDKTIRFPCLFLLVGALIHFKKGGRAIVMMAMVS
jgi:hypothetical protein